MSLQYESRSSTSARQESTLYVAVAEAVPSSVSKRSKTCVQGCTHCCKVAHRDGCRCPFLSIVACQDVLKNISGKVRISRTIVREAHPVIKTKPCGRQGHEVK